MSPLLGFGLLRKFSEPSFDGRGKSLSRVRGLERRAMFQSPSPGGRGKSIETGQSANAKELVRCFPLILRCRLDFLGPLCDRFVRTFRDGLCREEKAFRRQVPEADIGFFTFR